MLKGDGGALATERRHQQLFVETNIGNTVDNALLPRMELAAELPPGDPRKGQLLDAALAESDALIAQSPLAEDEKYIRANEARVKIKLAFAGALTPEERATIDPSHPANLTGLGWALAMEDVPYDERVKLATGAIKEMELLEKAEAAEDKEIARNGRAEIAKTGYDLMRAEKLTPEWLAENRDNLNETAYRVLSRSLEPDARTLRTDPQEYLRLLDLAETDPAQAIADVREAYGNGVVSKDVFERVYSRAHGLTRAEDRKPWMTQIRAYVNNALGPPADATREQYARHLDTMFIWDDWVRENPEATRDDARKFGEDLVKNQRTYLAAGQFKKLPLPLFADVPNRWLLNEDILNQTRERTAEAFRDGRITESQAAAQARLLDDWFAAEQQFRGSGIP